MAGKRGNSEGSTRKRIRDGEERWEARYVDIEGKRRSLYGKTRQEAMRNRENGVRASGGNETVADFLTFWFSTVKKNEVGPSSHLRYSFYLRLHIIPTLGKYPLTKLTAQHIQIFLAKELEAGNAPSSVRQLHAVLHDALDDALQLGLVSRNVADLVKPPRRQRHEYAIYSEDQARRLLETVAGDRLEALLVLVLTTGMRGGELDTLKWRDVELEGGSLQVQRTLQRTAEGFRWENAKTSHSRRRIALTEMAIAALRKHLVRQTQERQQLGEAWHDHDFVFTNAIGDRLPRTYFDIHHWYGAKLKEAGLPIIRFHDLRHTAATLLLARGVNPKVVSEMLGHSSVAITLTLYGHVTPHMQQEAANTMDQMLRPKVLEESFIAH